MKQNLQTEWRPGEVITADWLRVVSNWLAGMSSPDGSVDIAHNAGGIYLQMTPNNLRKIPGYDASKIQFLMHKRGVVQWITGEECE